MHLQTTRVTRTATGYGSGLVKQFCRSLRQPINCGDVNPRRTAYQTEIERIALVINHRFSQRIAHHRPRFLCHQMRRRDVPLIAPAERRYQIGAVAGYHRHSHRDAVRLGHSDQV